MTRQTTRKHNASGHDCCCHGGIITPSATDIREVLTGALVSSSEQVSPHHGPHPEETDADGYVVDRPVACLQNPPGQDDQDWDDKTIQELETGMPPETSLDIKK